jgi:hypothetical protein
MAIKFQCQGCGKDLTAPDGMGGRKAKCKVCATITVIPTPPPPSLDDDDIALAPLDEDEVAPPAPPPIPTRPVRVAPKAAAGPIGGIPLEDDDDIPMADMVAPPPSPAAGAGLARAGAAGGGSPVFRRQLRSINEMVVQRRYLEAAQALRMIAHEGNGNPGYHYLAGMAYAGLGNHPNALDHLNHAVQSGIRNPELLAAKGKAELELGRHSDAISSLDAALDLAGTDVPDYMADLARAYEGARMPKDAGATWAALARINPNHPALLQREKELVEKKHRRHQEQAAQAMVQMQKEQRASDTACWICLIIRILLECL